MYNEVRMLCRVHECPAHDYVEGNVKYIIILPFNVKYIIHCFLLPVEHGEHMWAEGSRYDLMKHSV